jgi:hypothetical protein
VEWAAVPTLVPSNNKRPTGLDLPFFSEGTGWSTNRSRQGEQRREKEKRKGEERRGEERRWRKYG